MVFKEILKVITEDIHRYLIDIGYRLGPELGRDFYTIAYQSYWIDHTLDEQQLVVKIIDFSHEKALLFEKPSNRSLGERSSLKLIKFKIGDNKTIEIKTTIEQKFVPDFDVFRNEIQELNRLNHQNVVIIKDILFFNDKQSFNSSDLSHVLMFVEFCDKNLKQELMDLYLNKFKDKLTVEETTSWSSQIARGLAYLHSRGISHSNLKPSNILVFQYKPIKGGILLRLSDFGLAMLFPLKKNEVKESSDLYRDPFIDSLYPKLFDLTTDELIYDSTKADIWSLGVIITEFCLNYKKLYKIFVDNYKNAENLGNVYLKRVEDSDQSKQMIDLLSKMLKYEQNLRLDIISVCNHIWIANEIRQQRQVMTKKAFGENGQQGEEQQQQQPWSINTTQNKEIDREVNELSSVENRVIDQFGLNDHECEKFIEEKYD